MAETNRRRKRNYEETPTVVQEEAPVTVEVIKEPVKSTELKTKVTPVARKCSVIVPRLNMRKKASIDSDIVTVLVFLDVIDILSEESDFYKVSQNGVEGYVMKEYVDLIEEN